MTTKNLTLSHQTTLAVNVIIQDETRMLAFSILIVTKLFTLFWLLSRMVMIANSELSMLVNELKEALAFTGKVLAIVLSSLAFGLGVKL